MSLLFTLNKAPISHELKDACGLPWACVAQPFAPAAAPQEEVVAAADISRCHECYAYICRQCLFQRTGWACALCGTLNEYSSVGNQRYLDVEERSSYAELRSDTVEAACSLLPGDGEGHGEEEVWEVDAQPLYVAVVDAACSFEFLEVVRSALLAALEALPPAAFFGLITVAEEIGLHEALESGPAVRYVPVLPTGPNPTTVELQDALPLASLLAPVGTRKEAIAAMLEAMQPHPPAVAEEQQGSQKQGPRRAVGSAVQAVMRYLGSAAAEQRVDGFEAGPPGAQDKAAYTGARLMLFLSGPPTHGRGSVVASRRELPASRMQVQLEPLLLDPVYPELTSWTLAEPEKGSERAAAAGQQPQQQEPQQAPQGQQALQAQAGEQQPGGAAAAGGGAGEVCIDLSHATHDGNGEELVVNTEASSFYEEAGVAAAALGVCCDVYALCPHFVGLELVQPLAGRSGGVVRLYHTLDDAPLPQDLYKRLCTPHAFGCLLRLRTSPELRVAARCHGNATPDPHYPNLFRVPACGPADTFALDLRHASSEGLADPGAGTPVVQLVFQYSVLAPAAPGAAEGGGGGGEGSRHGSRRYVLRRRLRVTTVALGVAATPLQVYTSCDAPTTALVLMHKVLGAAAAEGSLQAARALLREWLAALAASSSAVLASEEAEFAQRRGQQPAGEEGPGASSKVDVTFASLEALQPLPRLVYGLLASPLLHGYRPGRHPDEACALTSLWSALPPAELSNAIYPLLASWASNEEPAFPRHSLSRAAVEMSGEKLFLLDAYSEAVVYATADAPGPFPPPRGTALRTAVNALLRGGRAIMPRVTMVQEGTGDTSVFWKWMLEDGPPGQPDLHPFPRFLEEIEAEAASML